MSHSNKKKFWIILAVVCFIIAIASCIMIYVTTHGIDFDTDKYKNTTSESSVPQSSLPLSDNTTETSVTEKPEEILLDNPIDFKKLQDENEDIYAWIVVPGTLIDYPVVCHPDESEYYLRRDYLGNYSICGCIFSQFYNKKDFSDYNTVFYGHYVADGTYFGGLHNFRDPDFFKEHETITVYTPGHILTYKIFAAYESSNAHLLTSVDYLDESSRVDYFASCLAPHSMYQNVKEGVTLDKEDKIITLSTCVQNSDPSRRYLVQGVLIKDEKTK